MGVLRALWTQSNGYLLKFIQHHKFEVLVYTLDIHSPDLAKSERSGAKGWRDAHMRARSPVKFFGSPGGKPESGDRSIGRPEYKSWAIPSQNPPYSMATTISAEITDIPKVLCQRSACPSQGPAKLAAKAITRLNGKDCIFVCGTCEQYYLSKVTTTRSRAGELSVYARSPPVPDAQATASDSHATSVSTSTLPNPAQIRTDNLGGKRGCMLQPPLLWPCWLAHNTPQIPTPLSLPWAQPPPTKATAIRMDRMRLFDRVSGDVSSGAGVVSDQTMQPVPVMRRTQPQLVQATRQSMLTMLLYARNSNTVRDWDPLLAKPTLHVFGCTFKSVAGKSLRSMR